MKKIFTIIVFLLLIISCSTQKKHLKGLYFAEDGNDKIIIDFNKQVSNNYIKMGVSNNLITTKKFEVIELSETKYLLIFQDYSFNSSYKDSLTVNIIKGKSIFEISKNDSDTIYFRKTYSNYLEQTESKGLPIRFNKFIIPTENKKLARKLKLSFTSSNPESSDQLN